MFNTIGNDLVRYPDSPPTHLLAVTSYKAGTDVRCFLALQGTDIDTTGDEEDQDPSLQSHAATPISPKDTIAEFYFLGGSELPPRSAYF